MTTSCAVLSAEPPRQLNRDRIARNVVAMFEGNMIDQSDEALIAAIAAGDRAAADSLARRMGPFAYRFAYRLTGAKPDAEDLAQDALLRLIKAAPNWQSGPGTVKSWLWRVITNLSMDRGRRLQRQSTSNELDDIMDDSPAEDQRLQQAARADALQAALLALPDRQRQAVVLRYIEGLSMNEAATIMGVSPSALDSLANRGKRALAEELTPKRDALGAL